MRKVKLQLQRAAANIALPTLKGTRLNLPRAKARSGGMSLYRYGLKMGSVMPRFIIIALLLSLSLFLFSCTTPGGRDAGMVYDDTVIATKVKGNLTEMMGAKVVGVDVDVYRGEVTLQGRVRSPNMESRVIAVTARVHGVRKVINLLKIIP